MTGIIMEQPRDTAPSFAEPGEALGAADTMKALFRAPIDPIANPKPYADLTRASERMTRFTGNIASESAAREEAYDQRIAAIKAATGAELENPERDGYQQLARGMIRDQVRAGQRAGVDPNIQGGIVALQKQLFDQEFAKLQGTHPELQFGPIDDDTKKIALESIQRFQEARKAPGLNPFVAPIDVFGGGLLGSRRDPIFLGSLLAGPTSSTSRFALGRIASGAVRMGFYNAGISALEQPAVQEWRAKIGLEHGITPALEDVGQAFLFGAIPGAVIHGGIEGVRAVRMRRLLAGVPEPGDVNAVTDALMKAGSSLTERERAMLGAGEESALADKATMTVPRPKDVPPELHDDMAAAALKRADLPDEPSPEAVQIVSTLRGGYQDTRGGGRRFHGAPDEIGNLAEGHYGSSTSFYGASGFYTTNALDIAHGYANRRRASAPSIYEVTEKHPANLFDMEAEMPPNLTARLGEMSEERYGSTADLVSAALDEKPKNLREFFDAVRGHASSERILADEVQEGVFHPIMDFLEESGFHGMTHRGGLLTKSPEHGVAIYFNPEKSVGIRKMGDQELAGLREVADRVAKAAPKTEAEAARVADEAFDDLGRSHGMANLRDSMAAGDAERVAPHRSEMTLKDRGNGDLSIVSPSKDLVTLRETPEAIEIGASSVGQENRGRGIAVAMYERAIEYASEKGLPLRSDRTVSNDAMRVYEALERRGYRVTEAPGSTHTKAGISNFDKGYVYEVNPPAARPRGDVLDKVPFVDDSGAPKMMTAKAAAAIGERENTMSMLVKSCK